MDLDEIHSEDVDWRPLEAILPPDKCGRFMYMFWLESDGQRLHHYKHIDTRRYLILRDRSEAYRYTGDEVYVPTPLKGAINYALKDLEQLDPDGYPPGSVRRLSTNAARRVPSTAGMLAYHEEDDGQASR